MSFSRLSALPQLALACVLAALLGCSTGKMELWETHYLAVPSKDNVNYFRIRVYGKSKLGDSSFRSGWFPAPAVDALWGDASKAGASEAYKLENDLKKAIDDQILATKQAYVIAAANPKTDPAVLESLLAAERRVLATAGDAIPLPDGAIEIDYNPGANIALRHAGQKLVFVMSSNPDEVIGTISNFSQSAETGATVLRLADVIRQRAVDEVAATEARNGARTKVNAAIVARMDALAAVTDSANRTELTREIESLRILLENLR